nr:uncharacterized protein LOC117217646 [Megalopta genalis]
MPTMIRGSINEEINSQLYTWFLEEKANDREVTDTQLLAKALEICQSLGESTTFSGSWLQDFKTRHDIEMEDDEATDLSFTKISGILISMPPTSKNANAGTADWNENATPYLRLCISPPLFIDPHKYLKTSENVPVYVNHATFAGSYMFLNPAIADGSSGLNAAVSSAEMNTPSCSKTNANETEYIPSCSKTNANETEHIPSCSKTNANETEHIPSCSKTNANETEDTPSCSETNANEAENTPSCSGTNANETENTPSCSWTNANATVDMSSCSGTKAHATMNVPSCSKTDANTTVNMPSCSRTNANRTENMASCSNTKANAMETMPPDLEAQLFLRNFTRRLSQEKIPSKNIYYLKDTGLAWKVIPKNLLAPSLEERHMISKFEKECVTIGLCVNLFGNHKLAPLFIHKRGRSNALKHCRDQLPVIFASQPRAQMDHAVFTEWYNKHFKPTVRILQFPDKGGKVLLLLDSHQKHRLQLAKERSNDNFEIIFLPKSAASLMMAIEEKVVERVKMIYRLKMLHQMLIFPKGARRFYHDFDLIDCIDLLSAAWMEITMASIQNTWCSVVRNTWRSSLIEAEPEEDPLESTLQDIVGLIAREGQPEETVNEFLLRCQEMERHFLKDETEENGDEDEEKSNGEGEGEDEVLSHDDIKMAFETLVAWSKQQPQYIQLLVEYLKNYYERSINGNKD